LRSSRHPEDAILEFDDIMYSGIEHIIGSLGNFEEDAIAIYE
jgi:hypothetical protein